MIMKNSKRVVPKITQQTKHRKIYPTCKFSTVVEFCNKGVQEKMNILTTAL